MPFKDLVEEIIGMVAEEAERHGCRAEVESLRAIAAEGTSADRQIAVFEHVLAQGRSEQTALNAVVDHLVAETLEGCDA